MSVIIRLQRLPLTANASAIRQFFFGLKIPEGAVHIVGGDDGDAFIGFATDEDARQAMRLEGNLLHDARIKLMLSSRVEMEAVIAKARAGELKRASSSSSRGRSPPNDPIRSPSPKRPPPAVSGFGSFPSPYKNQISGRDISAAAGYFGGHGNNSGGSIGHHQQNHQSFGGGDDHHNQVQNPPPRDFQNRPLPEHNGAQQLSNRGDSWTQRPPAPRNDSWVTSSGRDQANNSFDSGNRSVEGQRWPPPPPQQQTQQSGGFGRAQVKEERLGGDYFGDDTRFFGGRRDDQRNAFNNEQRRGSMDDTSQQRYGRQPDMNVRDTVSSANEPPPVIRRPQRPSLLPAPPVEHQLPIDDFRQPQHTSNPNDYQQIGNDQRPFDQILRDQQLLPSLLNSGNTSGSSASYSRSSAGSSYLPTPPSQSQNKSRCVELSRLPAELLRPAAIEQFLRPVVPLSLSSVKVVYDQHGFPLHTLVRFDNADDAERTLARDGEQGIRIRPCALPDFECAVDGTAKIPPTLIPPPFLPLLPKSPSLLNAIPNGPSGPNVGGAKDRFCLQFSNLAYRADDRDIARFLGQAVVPTKITRLYYEDAGRASDRWLVEFDNMAQAEKAAEMHGEIRGRPVRITRTPNDQADRMLAVPDRYGQKKIEEFNAKGGESTEHMGPATAGRQQKPPPLMGVRQPFRGSGVGEQYQDANRYHDTDRQEPERHQDFDSRRRVPSRQSNHQRSRSPRERDRRSSSRSSYEAPASHSLRRDHQSQSNSHQEHRAESAEHRQPQPPPIYRQEAPLSSTPGSTCVKLTNLPMHATDRDVAAFLDARLAYHGAVHMLKDGCAFAEMFSETDCARALRQHRAYLGANCINIAAVSKDELNMAVRGGIQPASSSPIKASANINRQQQLSAPSVDNNKDVDPAVVASIGRPGTVIAVHGLPTTVTLDDLVAFFDRYQLLEDSVRMHFDDTGCPTGDCLLAMATPGEANKAVQELSGRRLNGSTVTMYVVRTPDMM